MYEIFHECGWRRELLVSCSAKHPAWDVLLRTSESDSGTLSFTTTAANPEISYLNPMKSEIVVERDGLEHWRGRYLDPEEDLTGTIQITVKGCLDYLRDTVQPEATLTCSISEAFSYLITKHNGKPIENNKKFVLGICDLEGSVSNFKISAGDKTWDVFKRLLRQYGGKLRLRRVDGSNVIDWISKNSHTCFQRVSLGINLLDMTKTLDISNLATVIYPFGKVTDGTALGIAAVNDGIPYIVDQDAVTAFGWIEDSYKESSIDSAATLKQAAQRDLADRLASVQAVDLQAIDLADVADAEQIEVHMDVTAVLQDTEITMPCVEVSRYLYEPTKTKISLGTTLKILSTLIGGSNGI